MSPRGGYARRMSDALIPCAACGRHLRASSIECPFCGVTHTPREVAAPNQGPFVSRAAIFAFSERKGREEEAAPKPADDTPATPRDAIDELFDLVDSPDPNDNAYEVVFRYGAPPPPFDAV